MRHAKELQGKLKDAMDKAAASEARRDEQAAAAKSLHAKNASLEAKAAGLEAKNAGLEAKNASLEAKVAGLEATAAGLEAKAAGLEEKLEPARAEANKVAGLTAQVAGLQQQLDAARAEASNRLKQVTRALTVQHEQRMQLEVLLASADRGFNPYAPVQPNPPPAAPQQLFEAKRAAAVARGGIVGGAGGGTLDNGDGADMALALQAARAEVAVMVRARAEDERRIAKYRAVVKDLRGKVGEAAEKVDLESSRAESMQREFEHKVGKGRLHPTPGDRVATRIAWPALLREQRPLPFHTHAALIAQGSELKGIRDQYLAAQSELVAEREQHANARRELEHARSIIQTAAGARRELEGGA